jgi:hypothetical protein
MENKKESDFKSLIQKQFPRLDDNWFHENSASLEFISSLQEAGVLSAGKIDSVFSQLEMRVLLKCKKPADISKHLHFFIEHLYVLNYYFNHQDSSAIATAADDFSSDVGGGDADTDSSGFPNIRVMSLHISGDVSDFLDYGIKLQLPKILPRLMNLQRFAFEPAYASSTASFFFTRERNCSYLKEELDNLVALKLEELEEQQQTFIDFISNNFIATLRIIAERCLAENKEIISDDDVNHFLQHNYALAIDVLTPAKQLSVAMFNKLNSSYITIALQYAPELNAILEKIKAIQQIDDSIIWLLKIYKRLNYFHHELIDRLQVSIKGSLTIFAGGVPEDFPRTAYRELCKDMNFPHDRMAVHAWVNDPDKIILFKLCARVKKLHKSLPPRESLLLVGKLAQTTLNHELFNKTILQMLEGKSVLYLKCLLREQNIEIWSELNNTGILETHEETESAEEEEIPKEFLAALFDGVDTVAENRYGRKVPNKEEVDAALRSVAAICRTPVDGSSAKTSAFGLLAAAINTQIQQDNFLGAVPKDPVSPASSEGVASLVTMPHVDGAVEPIDLEAELKQIEDSLRDLLDQAEKLILKCSGMHDQDAALADLAQAQLAVLSVLDRYDSIKDIVAVADSERKATVAGFIQRWKRALTEISENPALRRSSSGSDPLSVVLAGGASPQGNTDLRSPTAVVSPVAVAEELFVADPKLADSSASGSNTPSTDTGYESPISFAGGGVASSDQHDTGGDLHNAAAGGLRTSSFSIGSGFNDAYDADDDASTSGSSRASSAGGISPADDQSPVDIEIELGKIEYALRKAWATISVINECAAASRRIFKKNELADFTAGVEAYVSEVVVRYHAIKDTIVDHTTKSRIAELIARFRSVATVDLLDANKDSGYSIVDSLSDSSASPQNGDRYRGQGLTLLDWLFDRRRSSSGGGASADLLNVGGVDSSSDLEQTESLLRMALASISAIDLVARDCVDMGDKNVLADLKQEVTARALEVVDRYNNAITEGRIVDLTTKARIAGLITRLRSAAQGALVDDPLCPGFSDTGSSAGGASPPSDDSTRDNRFFAGVHLDSYDGPAGSVSSTIDLDLTNGHQVRHFSVLCGYLRCLIRSLDCSSGRGTAAESESGAELAEHLVNFQATDRGGSTDSIGSGRAFSYFWFPERASVDMERRNKLIARRSMCVVFVVVIAILMIIILISTLDSSDECVIQFNPDSEDGNKSLDSITLNNKKENQLVRAVWRSLVVIGFQGGCAEAICFNGTDVDKSCDDPMAPVDIYFPALDVSLNVSATLPECNFTYKFADVSYEKTVDLSNPFYDILVDPYSEVYAGCNNKIVITHASSWELLNATQSYYYHFLAGDVKVAVLNGALYHFLTSFKLGSAPKPVPGPAKPPAPTHKPEPAPAKKPAPEHKPEPAPAKKPAPEHKPEPAPAKKPAPEHKPEPSPAKKPAPEHKPEPSPAKKPAPEHKPEPSPAKKPAPTHHPAPVTPPAPKQTCEWTVDVPPLGNAEKIDIGVGNTTSINAMPDTLYSSVCPTGITYSCSPDIPRIPNHGSVVCTSNKGGVVTLNAVRSEPVVIAVDVVPVESVVRYLHGANSISASNSDASHSAGSSHIAYGVVAACSLFGMSALTRYLPEGDLVKCAR